MNPLAGLDIAVFTVIKCFHAKFYVLFCDVNLLKMRYIENCDGDGGMGGGERRTEYE